MSVQPIPVQRLVRKETSYRSASGYAIAVVALLFITLGGFLILSRFAPVALGVMLVVIGVASLPGLYMLQPNEAIIFTLFGKYQGTDRSEGLRWTNPLQSGQKISLRGGDRAGAAAAPACRGHRECPAPDRRRGLEPARGVVLRQGCPARDQHGHALHVTGRQRR
jgi:hypothetical protein